jgi:type II secretory pathway component PulJ
VKFGARGAVLLETMVALTILASAGVAALVGVSEAARTLERARQGESRVRDASAYLNVLALWPREDLDRHLGERRQGPWSVYIERRGRSLYYITLSDTLTGATLLWTGVFRPEVSGEDE